MSRTRVPLAALALGAALALSACGGGGDGDQDAQAVFDQTCAPSHAAESGLLDLDFKIETSGADEDSSLEAKVGGPFQGRGEEFPQFDFDVSAKAEGVRTFVKTGGVTSTGQAAFVNFQGTEYAVPQELFDRFVTSYTNVRSEGPRRTPGLLSSLGIGYCGWLTDLRSEGTEEIDGTPAVHISGKADVGKLVADLKSIARSSGDAPGDVTLDRLDGLGKTIESADFDLYSDPSDHTLRRLEASFELKPPIGTPGSPDSLDLHLQVTLNDVNRPQTINAPAEARPFGELAARVPALRPLALGGGAAPRGALGNGGALPDTGGPTAGPSAEATQSYLSCLSGAQSQQAVQRCAEQLSH